MPDTRAMSTSSHQPVAVQPAATHRFERVLGPEMWAAVAITAMWLAVLFDGIYGADLVIVNESGMNATHIPSAVIVAIFAFAGTAVAARRAFGRRGTDAER